LEMAKLNARLLVRMARGECQVAEGSGVWPLLMWSLL
jgi:hypothetical protein